MGQGGDTIFTQPRWSALLWLALAVTALAAAAWLHRYSYDPRAPGWILDRWRGEVCMVRDDSLAAQLFPGTQAFDDLVPDPAVFSCFPIRR